MFERPQLDQALAAPDRTGHSAEFAASLEQIADFVAADPANAREIDELVRTRIFPGFMHALLNLNEVGNGWHSTGNRTGFGTDYRFRAIANFGGIWWNSATEVIYYPLQVDQTGANRPATTPTRSASRPASPQVSTSTATGRSPCTHTPTCDSSPTRTASTRSATAPI